MISSRLLAERLFAGAVFAGGKLVKPKINGDETRLDKTERKLYFGFTLALFVVLLALDPSAFKSAAWGMGGVGIVVLFVLLYASYDSVFGRHPKV
jgi:uncharacterized MAPEG superfamily protein